MIWWKRLGWTLTVLFVLGLLTAASLAQGAQDAPQSQATVDSALLDRLAAGTSADFVVVMAERADLSKAGGIDDWSARGRYVYDTLREVAARSQAPVVQYAKAHGLAYRSYLTTNSVMVQGGGRAAVDVLASLPGVQEIRLPKVAYLNPVEPASTTSPDGYGWNMDTLDPANNQFGMQAAQVWNQYGVEGDGIVVANIDTGVYYQHAALDRQYRGNLSGNVGGPYDHDYNWYMPTSGCGDGSAPCDNDGHGSGTMGIMVGETADLVEQIGAAPGARWIACKGCEGNLCSEAALTGCADWMVAPCPIGATPGDPSCNPDMRPHVLNNSWGSDGCDSWYQAYVQAWVAAGIFPAFSAGNTTTCNAVGSPGDLPEAFGTAAHSSNGQNLYAGGPSCYFPTPSCDPHAHQIDPHLNAPTFGRTSDNYQGGYYLLSGTSGASPHTAGAVALLWSANPAYIGQIEDTFYVLEQSANHDVPAGNCGKPACAGASDWPNYAYGWGYLDALSAVEMVGGAGWGTLTGTVSEGTTLAAPGDPLPGVTVTVKQADGYTRSTTTDASGQYTMTLLARVYDVTAAKYGYLPQAASVSITSGNTTVQDFALVPAEFYTVEGYVTDAVAGWPLYARIDVEGYPASPTWSDPVSGYYSLTMAAGITYTFHVAAWTPGYSSQSRDVGPLTADANESFALDADGLTCSAPGYLSTQVYLADFEATDGGYTSSGINDDWAWGTPTVWPDACARGSDRCWGTNLSGNYASSASSQLLSPVIDLSGSAAPLVVEWWQAWHVEDSIFDQAYAEVSINGGSWTVMWSHTAGTVQVDWTPMSYDISAAAGGTVQFRWRLLSDTSINYEGYYVDQVSIGSGCSPQAGGLVVGNVFDANTSAALNGADVVNRHGYGTSSGPTADDPAVADGFYTLFAPQGSETFTATMRAYGAGVADVTVMQGDTVRHDFDLAAGQLAYAPQALHATLEMGSAATLPLALDNGGDLAASFEFVERNLGSQAALTTRTVSVAGAQATDNPAARTRLGGVPARDAREIIISAPSLGPQMYDVLLVSPDSSGGDISLLLATLGAYPDLNLTVWDNAAGDPTAADMAAYDVVLVGNNILWDVEGLDKVAIGDALADYVDGGGKVIESLYVPSFDAWGLGGRYVSDGYSPFTPSTLDNWDPDTLHVVAATHPIMAGVTAISTGSGIQDPGLAPGAELLATWSTTGYNAVALNDDVVALNWLIFDSADWVGDVGPLLHNAVVWLAPAEVPWLAEDPISGTLPALGQEMIEVAFDASPPAIAAPGEYYAQLSIINDTPYGAESIPVTLTVEPAPGMGKLAGQISSDRPGGPLAAQVLAENSLGLTWTTTSDAASGAYALWLDAGSYTVTASADGYLPSQAEVQVSSQLTTVQDFELVRDAAHIEVAPLAMEAALGYGQKATRTLHIANSGVATLDYDIVEVDRGGSPPRVTIPRSDGNFARGSAPPSLERAPGGEQTGAALPGRSLASILGAEAYAIDVFDDSLYDLPDIDLPGSWNLVGVVGGGDYYAADLAGADMGHLYVLDNIAFQLLSVDTATGAATVVGPCAPNAGQAWTGMAYDPIGGVMYASATDLTTSTLFRIALSSGAPTAVGTISGAPGIIDIAVDGAGQMYGLDIDLDALFAIDKATGAGILVGSVGFDANYAQGMDFDEAAGILYLAAFDNAALEGQLRIADTSTGNTTLVGAFPNGDEVDALAIATVADRDVPWLAEAPATGSVSPLDNAAVDVTFDAGQVPGVGTYLADLSINSTDPYQAAVRVAVTLTVLSCPQVAGVNLEVTGPAFIQAGDSVEFSADLLPDNAGRPLSYTIDLGDGSPLLSGAGNADPLTFSHAYTLPGTYGVEISVWNCGMAVPVTDSLNVAVHGPGATIYLPLVSKALP